MNIYKTDKININSINLNNNLYSNTNRKKVHIPTHFGTVYTPSTTNK